MNVRFPYSDNYVPAAPVIELRVTGSARRRKTQTVEALVDTGADATILPISLLTAVGAQFLHSRRMRGVLGKSYDIDIFYVTVEIAGLTLRGLRVTGVKDSAEEPIVGRDVLNRLQVLLDGPNELIDVSVPGSSSQPLP